MEDHPTHFRGLDIKKCAQLCPSLSPGTEPLYQYEELPWKTPVGYFYDSTDFHFIRLLQIKPPLSTLSRLSNFISRGVSDEPGYQIICTRLNSAPDYDAVSYAWGAAEKTHCISVNGGYSLPITKSIATGLSDLVHACRTGYLWIDQICINQNNLAERNAQVTIMGDIYARSMTCLIWIGSSDCLGLVSGGIADFDFTIEELELEEREQLRLNQGEFRRLFEDSATVQPPNEYDSLLAQYGFAIDRLLRQTWFERTWVFQETVLAPNPICLISKTEVSFDKLSEAIFYIFDKLTTKGQPSYQDALGFPFMQMAAMMRRHHQRPRELNLTFGSLLGRMADSEASDPRDHIYAYLGLFRGLMSLPAVSYGVSTAKIYTSMARCIVNHHGNPELFSALPHEEDILTRLSDLPSWVPDWSRQNKAVSLAADAMELDWEGRIVDRVEAVAPQIVFHQCDTGSSSVGQPWSPGALDKCMTELQSLNFPISDDLEERQSAANLSFTEATLLRTLLADGAKHNQHTILSIKDLSYSTCLAILEQVKTYSCNPLLVDAKKRHLFDALNRLVRILRYRRLVYFIHGRFGLVPHSTMKGDVVAILVGSATPVLLRAIGVNKWKIIGQCYHDGGMYGGLVNWHQDEWDTITLV